jgi:hypothetical protein
MNLRLDGARRRLYQRTLLGEDYGAPVALLCYVEYQAEISRARREYGSACKTCPTLLSPRRWTRETLPDSTQADSWGDILSIGYCHITTARTFQPGGSGKTCNLRIFVLP